MTVTQTDIDNMYQFFEEVFNQGNINAIDKYCNPNCVDHNPMPGQGPGAEGVKHAIGGFRAGFPDLKAKVNDIVWQGDKLVVRSTISGTNTGEMMGMPATGKYMSIDNIDIMRLENGKMVERWGLGDESKMMTQLGIVPTPGGPE